MVSILPDILSSHPVKLLLGLRGWEITWAPVVHIFRQLAFQLVSQSAAPSGSLELRIWFHKGVFPLMRRMSLCSRFSFCTAAVEFKIAFQVVVSLYSRELKQLLECFVHFYKRIILLLLLLFLKEKKQGEFWLRLQVFRVLLVFLQTLVAGSRQFGGGLACN